MPKNSLPKLSLHKRRISSRLPKTAKSVAISGTTIDMTSAM